MTDSRRSAILTIIAAIAVTGCGESSNENAPAGTVGFELEVIAFEPGEDDVTVSGAEVCVADTSNCGTTDADGLVELTLPANSEVTLTVTADGYSPVVSPQLTTDVDSAEIRTALLTESVASLLAGVLGTPYPFEGVGAIAISVLTPPITANDNGIPGVTCVLDNEATYYLDENGFPSFDLTATARPDGVCGYVEMAPGEYEVSLGGTASNCVPVSAWPGSGADSIRVPVRAGSFTQAFVVCDAVEEP
jgi:hypothetical protein